MARVRYNEHTQNWLRNVFRNVYRIKVITAVVTKNPVFWGYNGLRVVISRKVGLFS
jgi:hypothetical protein